MGATPSTNKPESVGTFTQQKYDLIESGQGMGATPGSGATPALPPNADVQLNDEVNSQEGLRTLYNN